MALVLERAHGWSFSVLSDEFGFLQLSAGFCLLQEHYLDSCVVLLPGASLTEGFLDDVLQVGKKEKSLLPFNPDLKVVQANLK